MSAGYIKKEDVVSIVLAVMGDNFYLQVMVQELLRRIEADDGCSDLFIIPAIPLDQEADSSADQLFADYDRSRSIKKRKLNKHKYDKPMQVYLFIQQQNCGSCDEDPDYPSWIFVHAKNAEDANNKMEKELDIDLYEALPHCDNCGNMWIPTDEGCVGYIYSVEVEECFRLLEDPEDLNLIDLAVYHKDGVTHPISFDYNKIEEHSIKHTIK